MHGPIFRAIHHRFVWPVVFMAAVVQSSHGQAVKGEVSAEGSTPPLTYHGLVPGLHNGETVRKTLGEPAFETRWYDWKMYYPAQDRPGLFDVVHMHGSGPDSGLANIDAASVPDGYRTESAILEKLGKPEYELRMATWKLLDYSEKGLRFSLTSAGQTNGVAYVPHGFRRVPEGERSLVDLSGLRQGPQPTPANPAPLEGLEAGVSEVVFSPTGKDWLAHPYTVHDDLKARTVVFTDGELTVALVGADLFGMGSKDINVMREAAREMGIDHMVLAMSHNHAAGDTIGVYGHVPTEYIAHIQRQVIAGLGAALASLEPVAEFRTASKELPMDGTRVVNRMAIRFDKRKCFRVMSAAGLLIPFATLIAFDSERPLMYLFLTVGMALGAINLEIMPFAMMADIADMDELKTHRRREGAFAGVYNGVYKAGLMVAPFFSYYFAELSGFDPRLEQQTPETIRSMMLFMFFFTAAAMTLSFVFALLYSLRRAVAASSAGRPLAVRQKECPCTPLHFPREQCRRPDRFRSGWRSKHGFLQPHWALPDMGPEREGKATVDTTLSPFSRQTLLTCPRVLSSLT